MTALRDPARETAWDLPTQLFHWALVVLVAFSWSTGKIGGPWMEWHMRSGYAVLALVLFRLGWGMVGSAEARFAAFVRGPRAGIEYARRLLAGNRDRLATHNPLGGWMVLLLLALLLVQAVTGLFSNDESSHEGPLAHRVSNALVDQLSTVHAYNQDVIVVAVAVHVLAIVAYQWILKIDVLRPMLTAAASRPAPRLTALVLLAAAAAFVYWLVAIFAKG